MMIPIGYMAKQILTKPDWLKSSAVIEICSVSACMSGEFADYTSYWKHNGFWAFDDPNLIRQIAKDADIDLNNNRFFYYEAYEKQYDEESGKWLEFKQDDSLPTKVKVPAQKELLGYDVAGFSQQSTPECSPLSCNNLAEKIEANKYCLLNSLEKAIELLESGAFNNSEPGPFRIYAVYTFL